MNIEFNSAEELYKKVIPALNVKRRELEKKNIKVKNEEIFMYLVNNVWTKKEGLALNDIVNDILSVETESFRKVK